MKGLRTRLNDPPFVSYIGLGPFLVVWGNGLEVDVGRLYFRFRVRAGRRPKTHRLTDEEYGQLIGAPVPDGLDND